MKIGVNYHLLSLYLEISEWELVGDRFGFVGGDEDGVRLRHAKKRRVEYKFAVDGMSIANNLYSDGIEHSNFKGELLALDHANKGTGL
jgi:hypothetical protein